MERKEERPLGRKKIWRLDATEAWTKWGFKEEGTANSVTWWVKDDKNSKCTSDREDVEMRVTVVGATSAAPGKEGGLDWRRGQRRDTRKWREASVFSTLWSRVTVEGAERYCSQWGRMSKQGFSREILEHVCVLLGLISAEHERGNGPQSQEKKEAGKSRAESSS